jgi:hypothetical protein
MEDVLEKNNIASDVSCSFVDIDEVDVTLVDHVLRACEL